MLREYRRPRRTMNLSVIGRQWTSIPPRILRIRNSTTHWRVLSTTKRLTKVHHEAQPRTHQSHASEAAPSHEEPMDKYKMGGFHPVEIGDRFKDGRYTIVRKLGWGRYSTVWLATDRDQDRHVALKILTAKASDTGSEHGLEELDILRRVMTADPAHPGYKHIVTMVDNFEHAGPNGCHSCVVLEAMADNMQGVEARDVNLRVPLKVVKRMTKHVLVALDYLHSRCGIVHSDIKPDNIMITSGVIEAAIRKALLRDQRHKSPEVFDDGLSRVVVTRSRPLTKLLGKLSEEDPDASKMIFKLGDLGVSNFVEKPFMDVIQPPALRCPEVILGAQWDTKADIWNLACMIYEELAGRWLFNPNASEDPHLATHEHLCQIIELLGEFPDDLLNSGKYSTIYFDSSKANRLKYVRKLCPITLSSLIDRWSDLSSQDAAQTAEFLSLMLKLRPEDRKDAATLLKHEWLRDTPMA